MKKRWICWVLLWALLLGLIPTFSLNVRAGAALTASDALKDVIKTMEGFSAKPYWDNSHWTVGYGTTCPEDKRAEYTANGISQEEALALFETQLEKFATAVNQFADKYAISLTQNQFDALVSFSYNCGTAWMSSTSGYFHTALREGTTGSAFIYAICLYSGSGNGYYKPQRRLTEANMYLNGVYKAHNAADNALPDTYKWVYLDANGGEVRYAIYGFDAAENKPVNVAFSSIPTGKDSEGKPFVYTLEGWYTADGRKVETLDSSLTNGEVLYAKWKDPQDDVVTLFKGEPTNMKVKVTSTQGNIRSGPGTYYSRVDKAQSGETLQLTRLYTTGNYTWGMMEKGWIRLDATDYAQVYASQLEFPKKGIINENGVNCRTGPSTSYESKGKMKKGDSVVITEVQYTDQWWGKTDKSEWIALNYVTYNEDIAPTVSEIRLLSLPEKLTYVQKSESLMPEGSILQITYADGSIGAMTLTREMTAFPNETLGTATATVTYRDAQVTFEVTIVEATITFLHWDGTVLSQENYAYGEEVKAPEVESREVDGKYYVFAGWDKELKPVCGNATYTAKSKKSKAPEKEEELPKTITTSAYPIKDGILSAVPTGTKGGALLDVINEKDYTELYLADKKQDGEALICTGMKLKLVKEAGDFSLTVAVTGDVNGDGDITITDMLALKSQLLGKTELSGAYGIAADVSADGAISITDFIKMKTILLGK